MLPRLFIFRTSAVYTVDLIGVAGGGTGRGGRVLGNLNINLDADLEAALGWKGASLHASALLDHGGQPNRLAGTAQGIDNFEVTEHVAKLYEAWFEQSFADGRADLRIGLFGIDSEFDVTDSAAIFLQPTMGTSSELAATGPYGPSIFPSTALAVRLNLQPRNDLYVRVAVLNAVAGDPGDPQGVNVNFDQGLLVIGETGWTGKGKVAVGVWAYTRAQPDLRDILPSGAPRLRRSQGAYLTVDEPIYEAPSGLQASAFLRLGVSDGATAPFRAAGATGVTAVHVLSSRPDSTLALGFIWGALSPKYRQNSADVGAPLPSAETGVELTYSDKLGKRLMLQPDLQYIHDPAGGTAIRDALVLGLRGQLTF